MPKHKIFVTKNKKKKKSNSLTIVKDRKCNHQIQVIWLNQLINCKHLYHILLNIFSFATPYLCFFHFVFLKSYNLNMYSILLSWCHVTTVCFSEYKKVQYGAWSKQFDFTKFLFFYTDDMVTHNGQRSFFKPWFPRKKLQDYIFCFKAKFTINKQIII